jgi:hypothetical protein
VNAKRQEKKAPRIPRDVLALAKMTAAPLTAPRMTQGHLSPSPPPARAKIVAALKKLHPMD